MVRPQVAVVGSVDEARTYDPAVPDPRAAQHACEELGRELALAGWDLVVYSAGPGFIESFVVSGYVGSGSAVPGSIHMHVPIGKEYFAEHATHPDLFDLRPDPSGDWEVAFYRSLNGCDGVLLVGGGRSTLVTGVIALALRLPLVAVASMGGNARKVWERLSGSTGHSDSDISEMGRTWDTTAAHRLVQMLDRQRNDALAKARTAARQQRDEAHRALRSLVVAIALLAASVVGLISSWSTVWGPTGAIALLVVVPVLAAAGGALIRTSLDVGRDWTRAGVLGAAAGLITGLLYVASQLVGTPEILDAGRSEVVRRLLFFVLPIGFVAGLTFDAVYAKLRGKDVSQAGVLDKI